MPGFDGTGPGGMGPMTGGGRGFCSPWGVGAGYRRYGLGRGVPYAAPYAPGATPYAPSMSREQEIANLQNQAQVMKDQLEQMEARIQELKG